MAVDWLCLGHACWLIEAAGLRLLCDPLIEPEHQAGVFEVTPRRRLRASRLRPDFILISHRHPDHFDVASLAALAALDRDSVVVTPDALVARAARALGFRRVEVLPPGQLLTLDGLRLVTTPSLEPDEWGIMVATDDGVVWNQVDTVFEDAAHVRRVTARALAALGRARVDLLLAQWQPMLEIAAQLGGAVEFPLPGYAALLRQIAAVEPRALVPSSADTAHTRRWRWLNHVVHPVERGRFLADARQLIDQRGLDATVHPGGLGTRYRLRAGELTVDMDESLYELELQDELESGRTFEPLAMPPVRAWPRPYADEASMCGRIDAWVAGELGAALAERYAEFAVDRPLTFCLRAVAASGPRAWSLRVDHHGARVTQADDPSWDVLNVLPASALVAVLDGELSWSDVLLAGDLRALTRAYRVTPDGLAPANVAATFLYYALPYDASFEHATLRRVQRARASAESGDA